MKGRLSRHAVDADDICVTAYYAQIIQTSSTCVKVAHRDIDNSITELMSKVAQTMPVGERWI